MMKFEDEPESLDELPVSKETLRLGITVGLWGKHVEDEVDTESYPPYQHGGAFEPLPGATFPEQEEAAVRLAEQVVREAFARHRRSLPRAD